MKRKFKRFMGLICLVGTLVLLIYACEKETNKKDIPLPIEPHLVFKFKIDSLQERLDTIGQPSFINGTNRAQSPKIHRLAVNYIELANEYDSLGQGKIILKPLKTNAGGNITSNFSQMSFLSDGQDFFSIPISRVPSGKFKWLRISVVYQNMDVQVKSGTNFVVGTISSFLEGNIYVANYKIKTKTLVPAAGSGNIAQGYWGMEYIIANDTVVKEGQLASRALTVVNPMLFSPIPKESGVITAKFALASGADVPLDINASLTKDVVVTVSLSTNKSFEWFEKSGDNYFEPIAGDSIVDMGLRGMHPVWAIKK